MRTAITGIGIRSAIGCSAEAVVRSLRNRVSGIRREEVPGLGMRQVARVSIDGCSAATAAELPLMDRVSVLAVEAANAALADAGLERMGGIVIVGCSKGGMESFERIHRAMLHSRGPAGSSVRGGNGSSGNREHGLRSSLASHRFPLHPFLPSSPAEWVARAVGARNWQCVSGACASGALAIAAAARRIASGSVEIAIAGGTEASITPLVISSFENLGVLSDDAIRPFDRRRSGFVVGEGAAMVVMESEERARKRDARIYGFLDGWASGSDATGLVAQDPTGAPLALLIRQSLERAAMGSEELAYVNAHGSATRLNDVAETRALKLALGEHARRIVVSGTKPFTGHTLGAAGAIEAVVSLLAMRDGFVPPTLGLEEPDPECDLDYCPHLREVELPSALSVSIGFGGHTACLVLRKD